MERSQALGLVAAIILAAGPAAAQEVGPVEVETLEPITVERTAAEEGQESSAAFPQGLNEIPLLTPFSEDEVAARKELAARDPQVASPADQVLEGPTAQVAARVTASFRGINIFEAGAFTPTAAFFAVPPDPQVAASNTRVIEVVNVSIRMRTRSGGLIQTLDLNDFFGAPRPQIFEDVLFDPKIIYDANAKNKRFYVVALQTRRGAAPPNFSFIYLAVSRSASPANLNPRNWCFYRINALRNRGTQLESWADFPALGAGADALVITANQFTFDQFFFTFSIVRAINKLALSNNAGGCPGARQFIFQASNQPGDPSAFTLQPVQHLTSPSSFAGTTNPVYLTNTLFTPGFTPVKDYRVWRLRNVASTPSLSFTTVRGNFGYFIPPNAPQNNEAGFITTGDERMEEAAGVGDAFWGTHATACSFPQGGNVSCNRVIRVSVGQSAGGALQASITQQRTFGSPNVFLFWPGIAVNRDETVAVPVHFASAANNYVLSTRWTVKALGEAVFGPLRPLATGGCQQVSVRTGDYIGAETDPVDLRSFWLSGERARRIPQFDNLCLWETRIIRVTPATAAAGAPVAAGSGSPD